MADEILVSVIIPTYNREKTISDSLLSVTGQSITNIEVLIIDDGSTDSTEQLIQKSAKYDERIKYYKQKNGGANKARNLGIRLAKGKYIAFNDSDDLWKQDKLKKELSFLDKNKNYKGVFSKFKLHLVNEDKELIAPEKFDGPLYLQMLQANVINTPNFIIESKTIREFGGFNETLRRFQDWELATKIAKKYLLFFMDEVLVDTYQYGSGHISNNKVSGIESYKYIEEEFEEDRNGNSVVKCNFYFNMVTFMYGTKEFRPNLIRSIKLCNYNIKLMLKYAKFLLRNQRENI